MQYTIDADEEFLRVKFWGRETDRPPSEVCAEVLNLSARLDRPRILIELDQKVPLSSTSQFNLVARLRDLGYTPQHRIALVHRTPEMQQANQFINVIAENRGMQVRNFPALDAAKAWLREPASEGAA